MKVDGNCQFKEGKQRYLPFNAEIKVKYILGQDSKIDIKSEKRA